MKKNIMLVVSIIIIAVLSVSVYQLKGELSKSEHENTKLIIENSDLFIKNNKLDSKIIGMELKQIDTEIDKTNKNITELEKQNTTKIKSSTKEDQQDGYSYHSYKITSVHGNKIKGISIDSKSKDNQGIFLYQSELDVQLQEGDQIAVKFGKYGDDIVNVVKLTK